MLELFHRFKNENITLKGDLAFVNDWDFFAPYPATQFEQLTTTGAFAGSLSAFTAGVTLRGKYLHLLEQALQQPGKISFWAGECDRVIDSAKHFANGFFGLDWEKLATLHIIPETTDRGANTLTPGRACPNYASDTRGHDNGIQQHGKFVEAYMAAIGGRLSAQNPGVKFTAAEIFSMQEICAFETLAKGRSLWCDVFTKDDMLGFEYARDVLHYYRLGPGNHYGPTLGWLWLDATADLLGQGPESGPLFLSFNHDGDMIAMMTALELFPQKSHLSTEHIDRERTWRTSDVVPMGARFIIERFVCPIAQNCWDNAPMYPNHVYCDSPQNETFVRVTVNDGVVPLPGCTHGIAGACPLQDFQQRIEKRGRDLPNFSELCGVEGTAPQALTFLHQ